MTIGSRLLLGGLNITALACYFFAFSWDWKAALLALVGAILAYASNETYKDLRNEG